MRAATSASPMTMMLTDDLIPLARVPKLLPGSPRKPSTVAVWRWYSKGIVARDGTRIRLRGLRLGRRLFFRVEDVEAFARELADRCAHADAPPPRSGRRPRSTTRSTEAANKAGDELGRRLGKKA